MPQFMSGPGLGLAAPQNLYPSALQGAPIDNPSNRQCLAPGQELPLPAGDWYISLGEYLILEFFDPVNGIWTMAASASQNGGGLMHVSSDGFNLRIANRLGCPVSASIIAFGTAYVQGTTTITQVSAAASQGTWLPIVGGSLVLAGTSITTASAGAGYGVAPIVFIPPPPPAANNPNGVGGIQASGFCSIASGTVSGFTFTNPGAGYPTAPAPVILPNPSDPNLAVGITAATITFSLSSLTTFGGITGVLCTNPGAPLANGSLGSITLSIGGAGTGGSITANVLQTIQSTTVSGTGAGYSVMALGTYGGGPVSGVPSNSPEVLGLAFRPRQANVSYPSVTAGAVGSIVDGGMFLSAPTAYPVLAQASGAIAATLSTLAVQMGSRPDIAIIQPAP